MFNATPKLPENKPHYDVAFCNLQRYNAQLAPIRHTVDLWLNSGDLAVHLLCYSVGPDSHEAECRGSHDSRLTNIITGVCWEAFY